LESRRFYGQNDRVSILAPNRKPISRYQPRGREVPLPPLPPRWRPPAMWEKHRPEIPLWRFVFLSMLLHALGILLFGAPAGGSREGRAMWGSFDVVIRDSFREPGPALRFDRGLTSPRLAPVAPPAPAQPAPQAAPQPPAKVEPPVAAPVQREERAPEPVPPVLDRIEPRPEIPTFEVPAPSELLEAPRVERALAEPPKIEAPPPAPKPIDEPRNELPVAPRIERQMAEPPKIEAPPMPPPKPIEVPRLEAPVMPRVERQLAEPPKIDAPVARPVQSPALPAPRIETAPAPAPRIETAPAPKVKSAPAPKVEPAAPPVTAPSQELQTAPRTAPPSERVTTPSPAPRDAAPRIERESPSLDTPSPFRTSPAAKPGADYDPTGPSLDLDAMRKRAGDLTRAGTGNRAALPFPMPPVEKPKNKMEEAIEKARKPDCRTAYQSLGLAAVVPLIANEFGEGTCRW
jgi:hypothetical protein